MTKHVCSSGFLPHSYKELKQRTERSVNMIPLQLKALHQDPRQQKFLLVFITRFMRAYLNAWVEKDNAKMV